MRNYQGPAAYPSWPVSRSPELQKTKTPFAALPQRAFWLVLLQTASLLGDFA
jgi:hypothetical protein